MDQSYEELRRDLERYIEEHWVRPEQEYTVSDHSSSEPGRDKYKRDDFGEERFEKCREDFEEDFEEEIEKDSEDGRWERLKGKASFEDSDSSVSLEELILEVGETFHEVLFRKIRQSGMTDVEVYKRANMDRKLFSKIRSNPAYHPRKDTVLALAIALRLDIRQTEELLARAEYAFSPGSKSDVIIRYFIERRVYDIHMINIALYDHGMPVLE